MNAFEYFDTQAKVIRGLMLKGGDDLFYELKKAMNRRSMVRLSTCWKVVTFENNKVEMTLLIKVDPLAKFPGYWEDDIDVICATIEEYLSVDYVRGLKGTHYPVLNTLMELVNMEVKCLKHLEVLTESPMHLDVEDGESEYYEENFKWTVDAG